MTNQNDTQDEAERLAEVMIASLVTMNNQPVHRPDVLKYAFKAGYRAGVASRDEEYKRSPLSLALCKSASINVELMEDMEKLKRENEQLKTALETQTRNMDWLNNENTLVETKLAAEKQKALKLVEALKYYRGIVKGTWGYDGIIAAKYDNAISDYSTDSGDGGGNG